MRRDTQLKWLIVLLTILVSALLVARLDLTFPIRDLFQPLVLTLILGAAAWFYRQRSWQFVLCLTALLHVTLFTSAYSVLMYCGGALGQPFIDDHLASFDALCGIHLPSIVDWANYNSTAQSLLNVAYHSLLIQTPFVIIVLGFRGKRQPLEGFVLQFMISTIVTAMVFFAFPAEGPFAKYGYTPNASQAAYLDHLHGLRSGERTVATWREAEGLITFPSYHTTWAILLAYAMRRHGWLTALFAVLNIAVVAATLTTGWHYFADVIGGSVLAIAAIAVCHALEPWLNANPIPTNADCSVRNGELTQTAVTSDGQFLSWWMSGGQQIRFSFNSPIGLQVTSCSRSLADESTRNGFRDLNGSGDTEKLLDRVPAHSATDNKQHDLHVSHKSLGLDASCGPATDKNRSRQDR